MAQEKGPGKAPGSTADGDETFFGRWSRLKSAGGDAAAAEVGDARDAPAEESPAAPEPPPELTDEDMPDVESLDENSDVSAFFSAGVSEGLRRKALRKLFTGAKFNIRDGLDDYDDDFRSFTPLGGIMTADMRHHAERKVEALKKAAEERLASAGEADAEVVPEAQVSEAESGEAGGPDAGGADPAGSSNEEPRDV